MSPRFVEVENVDEIVDEVVEHIERAKTRRRRRRGPEQTRNLLHQETVPMTVLAQDPIVLDRAGPIVDQIPVPADRLQRGPRNHRFHVVDISVNTDEAHKPVVLHDGDPWVYRDRWLQQSRDDPASLVEDRDFRAQNVFAVAAHTLALFERHLGRPIPWHSGFPQLFLVPQARLEANAFYSREHNAVLFGWLPRIDAARPPLYTALSFDVIAHEVSHAILDGLRPRYTEPGLPDQLAFHEALADLVAMFSVFDLKGVAEHLLDPHKTGRIRFESDAEASKLHDPQDQQEARAAGRAATLKQSPLTQLAEQLGSRRSPQQPAGATPGGPYPALRRSIDLAANDGWKHDPQFSEPHRRAEVLVAAFLQTFVAMWANRLEPLRADGDGMDVSRVAEEGTKSASHLLSMLLRALDYLPPVELEFADVIDSVLTADRRLAPDDEHDYRGALQRTFAAFGITPPEHRIVDEDGVAAPTGHTAGPTAGLKPPYPPDPDATSEVGIRYEHLNLIALATSTDEAFQFIWSNAASLEIDVRFPTRVERVLASTRVGPDGLVVTEIIADYTQTLRTTAAALPNGVKAPDGMAASDVVEMWGGGVLVFDQFGRFRLHQRKPLLEVDRQTRRLQHLYERGLRGAGGSWGTSDGAGDTRRFALLHREALAEEG